MQTNTRWIVITASVIVLFMVPITISGVIGLIHFVEPMSYDASAPLTFAALALAMALLALAFPRFILIARDRWWGKVFNLIPAVAVFVSMETIWYLAV